LQLLIACSPWLVSS